MCVRFPETSSLNIPYTISTIEIWKNKACNKANRRKQKWTFVPSTTKTIGRMNTNQWTNTAGTNQTKWSDRNWTGMNIDHSIFMTVIPRVASWQRGFMTWVFWSSSWWPSHHHQASRTVWQTTTPKHPGLNPVVACLVFDSLACNLIVLSIDMQK